jgi:hypothetical protein
MKPQTVWETNPVLFLLASYWLWFRKIAFNNWTSNT